MPDSRTQAGKVAGAGGNQARREGRSWAQAASGLQRPGRRHMWAKLATVKGKRDSEGYSTAHRKRLLGASWSPCATWKWRSRTARPFASFQEKPKQKMNKQKNFDPVKSPDFHRLCVNSENPCPQTGPGPHATQFGTSGSGYNWRANVWWIGSEIRLKRMREEGPNRGEHQKAKSKASKAQGREIPDWGAEMSPSPSPAGCQRQRARKRRGQPVPLVPIHSWSCSSLKVSLTFPPDLLYMPDNGTAGRRSWGHKSMVRERNQ